MRAEGKKGFQCRSEIRERSLNRSFRVAQVLDAQHFGVLCAGDFYLFTSQKRLNAKKGMRRIEESNNKKKNMISYIECIIFRRFNFDFLARLTLIIMQ